MNTEYKKSDLKKLYRNYPDVVTLLQFREMLGGISDGIARKLMQSNIIEHFYINGTYLIPKKCVIDYVMSRHYKILQLKLKHHIQIPDLWNGNIKN